VCRWARLANLEGAFLAGIFAVAAPATVRAAPAFRLVDVRECGTENCPPEMELRMSVALGSTTIRSRRTQLRPVIGRSGEHWSGSVEIADEEGMSRGRREIETSGERCDELADRTRLRFVERSPNRLRMPSADGGSARFGLGPSPAYGASVLARLEFSWSSFGSRALRAREARRAVRFSVMDRQGFGQIPGVEPESAAALAFPVEPEGGRLEPRALFEEHFDYVWNSLRRLGVSSAELEDVTHDTFLQVFRAYERYETARPIKPWLFGFAFRVASDYRRRNRRRAESFAEGLELVDPASNPAEQLAVRERLALAQAALDTLELTRRAVFILHELDGIPIPEVASTFGIPLATAYSRLRLARADFAQAALRLERRQR
jgi:RNA polymerase sigma-70 factor (ECF subfamily)